VFIGDTTEKFSFTWAGGRKRQDFEKGLFCGSAPLQIQSHFLDGAGKYALKVF
jgi:hypothetical protein